MRTALFGSTGRRLRVLRSDFGLSVNGVVDLLRGFGVEVSPTTVRRYESDDTAPPGDVLAGLARVLGTTADYLVMLTDDPMPRAEVSDQRMLSLLEEVAVAYEVDRDVERLLKMWAALSVEDRRLLFSFEMWLVVALVGGGLVMWVSKQNSGCGVLMGIVVGVLLVGMALASMSFTVSGTLKLKPASTPTVSAPGG